MKRIDQEIAEVERTIAARKMAMRMTAQAAKTRTRQIALSPVTLGVAALAGFVLAGGLIRRRRRRPVRTVERRRAVKGKEPGKLAALGTLAMTGITWAVRSQFGGPVGLARFVLEKINERRPPVAEESRPPAAEGSRPWATAGPAQIPR